MPGRRLALFVFGAFRGVSLAAGLLRLAGTLRSIREFRLPADRGA